MWLVGKWVPENTVSLEMDPEKFYKFRSDANFKEFENHCCMIIFVFLPCHLVLHSVLLYLSLNS